MPKALYLFNKIPLVIMFDSNLKDLDKILFSLILNLSTKYNYCFASNSKLGSLLNRHPNTISISVNNLRKQGYVITQLSKSNHRKIYPVIDKLKGFDKDKINLSQESEITFEVNDRITQLRSNISN